MGSIYYDMSRDRLMVSGNKTTTTVARSLIEDTLGRPLLKSEVVHHIDGDTCNDKLENLMVMSRSAHMSHHKKGSSHTEETKKKISNSCKGQVRHTQKHSPESKWQMSVAKRNKESQRTMLGKHHSEETRIKISESQKISWQRRREVKENGK